MTFPCIIVERPHQRPGRAWAARSEQEILDAAHAKEGDWLAEHVGDRAATVDDALEALGHDLHSLTVLESAAEAEALCASGGHNVPISEIRAEAAILGWRDTRE